MNLNLNHNFARQLAMMLEHMKQAQGVASAPGFIEFLQHAIDTCPPGNAFAEELRECVVVTSELLAKKD